MARPEAQFWDYLRGLLPPEIHYSRIESETCPGFPDLHFTFNGVSGTLELKSTKKPGAKFPFSGENGLRQSQVTWIRDELEAKGWVLLGLQCGQQVYILQAELYYDELYRMTLDDIRRVADCSWTKGQSDICNVRHRIAAALVNKA